MAASENDLSSYQPVEATLRGLNVLSAVSRLGVCSVNEVHAETGLSRATIVRMLETLIFGGYVYRHAPGRYALTARTLGLSAGYRSATEISAHAPPILSSLQDAVGWPSDVAICDGIEMVTVATSPASGRLSLNQPAGFRASLLGTSLGLAYLAFAPERERVAALRALALRAEPWNDLARDPERAARMFAAIRRRGYATIDRRALMKAQGVSLHTFGAPVLLNGAAIASINVIFLREAVDIRTAIKKFLPHLQSASARLAALVSH
jgi:IclR family mhp operon transcriptional activator